MIINECIVYNVLIKPINFVKIHKMVVCYIFVKLRGEWREKEVRNSRSL